eukprot:8835348-Pyramimonas_sp.AAC.1
MRTGHLCDAVDVQRTWNSQLCCRPPATDLAKSRGGECDDCSALAGASPWPRYRAGSRAERPA